MFFLTEFGQTWSHNSDAVICDWMVGHKKLIGAFKNILNVPRMLMSYAEN
jgi:hypothetical protein